MAAMSREDITLALHCLDLTSLNDDDTPASIDRLCAQADQGASGTVAAVCVYPQFVAQAARQLAGKGMERGIGIATVVNFPTGKADIGETRQATIKAIADGATEIDIVMDYDSFLSGYRTEHAADLLRACAAACAGKAKMKVILETAALDPPETAYAAAYLALECGADFLKTSTGKHPAGGATLQAASAMLRAIRDLDSPAGLKLSGGLRTVADCEPYFAKITEVMGRDWITPEHFRIGASSLLQDLLNHLGPPGKNRAPAPGGY